MCGWIRFADERPVDAAALTLFADAFPPPLFALVGRIGWVPTIELTVQVRRRPVDGWVLGTALDLARGTTQLAAFDAARLGEGPLAVARLPYALPLGFHGIFVPA